MKLSLPPKLVENLVWVPVFRFVKFPYFADTRLKDGIGGEREGDFMDNFNNVQINSKKKSNR